MTPLEGAAERARLSLQKGDPPERIEALGDYRSPSVSKVPKVILVHLLD